MAAWITIYLDRCLLDLNAGALQQGLSTADWLTLGESVGVEDEEVEAFMQQLQWGDERLEFSVEPDQRPVQISVWSDPARVSEELSELRERDLVVPASVEEHLGSVQGIIAIELGSNQLQTMYEIVAFEIAYWLAEEFGGVILAADDRWYDAGENRWQPIGE